MARIEHGQGNQTCRMCGAKHTAEVSMKFCSNSCRLVYLWRLEQGFVVSKG